MHSFSENFFHLLGPLEEELERGAANPTVLVLVTGLPRSGTTFLTQLLQRNTNVEGIDGVAARFWQSPLVGITLSKQSRSNRVSSRDHPYWSDHGSSPYLSDPHEFSYFWQRFLGDSQRQLPQSKSETPSKAGELLLSLNQISATVGAPVVMKPMEMVLPFVPTIASDLPNSLVVFVDRPASEVFSSMQAATRRAIARGEKWWGSVLPNFLMLKLDDSNADQAVMQQISFLRQQYAQALEMISDDRKLVIRYENLIKNPEEELRKITEAVSSLGYPAAVIRAVSSRATARNPWKPWQKRKVSTILSKSNIPSGHLFE